MDKSGRRADVGRLLRCERGERRAQPGFALDQPGAFPEAARVGGDHGAVVAPRLAETGRRRGVIAEGQAYDRHVLAGAAAREAGDGADAGGGS